MTVVEKLVCTGCRISKPVSGFFRNVSSPTGYSYRCKSCRKRAREESKTRPCPPHLHGTVNAYNNYWCRCDACSQAKRSQDLFRSYGLTLKDYERLVTLQGGVCKICFQVPDKFCVDHDHSCCPGAQSCGDCVRGLLCQRCNTAIGMLEDDVIRLSRAIEYLSR